MVMEKFGSCVWMCGRFWLWRNFGGAWIFDNFLVIWVLTVGFFWHVSSVMENFWTCDFASWKFFVMWVFCWHGNWWAKLLCYRALRVESVSKCWKMHRHHYLLALKTSLMKQALALSLKLCYIKRHMNRKIFIYFFPWQGASRTLPAPSIFQALGR